MNTENLLSQLDTLYRASDISQAETLLLQTISNCRQLNDKSGLLICYNELLGLYRVTGRAESGAELADQALTLITEMNLIGTTQHGTLLLNAATVNRVAGHLEKALKLYQLAEEILILNGQETSYYMASLYNNMSQLYQDLGKYEKALEFQKKALFLIQSLSDSSSEIATTQVNISYTYMALDQLEHASEVLEQAALFYHRPEGNADSHYGAFLAALGQLAFQKKNYASAMQWYEKALKTEQTRYGENDACRVIRANLAALNKKMNPDEED